LKPIFFLYDYQNMEVIRISDIENYTQETINGVLIFTPKNTYITEAELNMMNLRHSKITKCIIKKGDKQITTNKRYRSVLVDIWKTMPPQLILQTTTFNFKLTNEDTNGYHWCCNINMSFQSKDAKGTLKEILHMVKVNRMSIDVSIRLETGKTVHFKIE